MNGQTIIHELALQEAVRRQVDDIVRAANATAALLEGSDMEKSQTRNVLNVARESGSVPVVTNFVRYQIGRSRTGEAWQHESFGLQVIDDLEHEDGPVQGATRDAVVYARDLVEERGGQADESELEQEIKRQLMHYYLGYLHRAFYFGKETGEWDRLREAGEG
jgi:hypothetical protein